MTSYSSKKPHAVDWFAEIDRRLPPWHAQRTTQYGTNTGLTPEPNTKAAEGWAPEDVATGTRTIMVGYVENLLDVVDKGVDPSEVIYEITMPYQPYVRAINPAGQLVPLLVSQTREESGIYETGHGDRIKAAKRRLGWLIAERNEEHGGRTGQDYGRLIFEEMAKRQVAHDAKQKALEKAFVSRHDQRMEDTAAATLDAVKAQGDALREIALRAVGGAPVVDQSAQISELREQNRMLAEQIKILMERVGADKKK